jgi:hypothetical protein
MPIRTFLRKFARACRYRTEAEHVALRRVRLGEHPLLPAYVHPGHKIVVTWDDYQLRPNTCKDCGA